jgi:hypothetical protein
MPEGGCFTGTYDQGPPRAEIAPSCCTQIYDASGPRRIVEAIAVSPVSMTFDSAHREIAPFRVELGVSAFAPADLPRDPPLPEAPHPSDSKNGANAPCGLEAQREQDDEADADTAFPACLVEYDVLRAANAGPEAFADFFMLQSQLAEIWRMKYDRFFRVGTCQMPLDAALEYARGFLLKTLQGGNLHAKLAENRERFGPWFSGVVHIHFLKVRHDVFGGDKPLRHIGKMDRASTADDLGAMKPDEPDFARDVDCHKALAALPPKESDVILLCVDHHSLREIAAETGLSFAVVRRIVERDVPLLAQLLEDYQPFR